MDAKRMLLEDAIETAIKAERKFLLCNADCICGCERVPSGLYVGEVILWIEDL